MANTFLSASSDHYCRVHDNQTYQENSRLKNCTIPYEVDDGEVEWSKCDRYNVTDQDCYDGEAEFDLVCEKDWMKQLSKAIYPLGSLFGTAVIGQLSDKFGRKPCFFSCLLLLIIVVFITACAPVYAVFAVGQFFIGFLSVGLFTVAFVLGLELVGPGKRDLAGMVILIFYACGYMMLAVFSKAVNGNWRQLELLIAILYVPFFSYY
uniref:Organic cation transporter-like protein-like n=1 Tax=Saccoglossus kowalevskii TaxID=10224 RepID=A0ABM0LUH9_SACKO